MTEFVIAAASAPLNVIGGIAAWQWAKGWPMERRGLKQRMLAAVPGDFADRVLREHPDWRDGVVPMGRVRLVLRLYGRD